MAREKLTRGEQRYNYAIAILVGAVFVALIVVSVSAVVAVLVAAFLFGLGQMVIGLSRRRRFLKGLEAQGLHGPQVGTTVSSALPGGAAALIEIQDRRS